MPLCIAPMRLDRPILQQANYGYIFAMSDYPMLKALTATAVPAIIRCLELLEAGRW